MTRLLTLVRLPGALCACKHPLEIGGKSSIVERIYGERGCSWQEFQAASPRCTENDVRSARYLMSYRTADNQGQTA
ncbi:hypothetical protein F0M18_16410 [Pseudohalioglobus sediminis]|uniref:Uncharacterized protein n=1 Tax=Pseudohalioglobus sediminis TaxID=2606449 RepID=A0A5B0WQ77_9GAMM|nr:hypothetical protein [Pseudohalioglobus sediminis]KAA1189254.1 hypothetical protein F0M18_16410 [Pseudohalioglobus sediminis]